MIRYVFILFVTWGILLHGINGVQNNQEIKEEQEEIHEIDQVIQMEVPVNSNKWTISNSEGEILEDQTQEEQNQESFEMVTAVASEDQEMVDQNNIEIESEVVELPEGTESVESKLAESSLATRNVSEILEEANLMRQENDYDIWAAVNLYQIAADQNSTEAMMALGEIFLYGESEVESNATMAVEYFNRSATFGESTAQMYLGFLYSIGYGVPRDDALAVLNLYFASIADNIPAKLMLGYRHMHGFGVPKVCNTAASYYEAVAQAVVNSVEEKNGAGGVVEKIRLTDDSNALSLFGKMFGIPGTGAPGAPTGDGQLVEFYRHAAAQGDPQAQMGLGQLHYFGAKGVEQNYEAAHQLFQQAARQGDTNALTSLGQMYAYGHGVPQNNETALRFFQQAADKGSISALNGLGFMYMNGMGVPEDPQRAVQYFKKAADQGSPDAQFNLGALYYSGVGVKVDLATSLSYFTLASQQGHTRAMFNLAQMHMHGLATPKSCGIALKLYKVVAEKGEWASILKEGFTAHTKGNDLMSFLLYARAAEEGFEVAQHNSAWLLDKGAVLVDENSTLHTNRYELAFYFWTRSAEQGNNEALRMIGDYFYYGKLAPRVTNSSETSYNESDVFEDFRDFDASAQSYLSSADAKNAQAMYNVGYMYEHGLGFQKDLHLAKRYYDMALSNNPNAVFPVRLALIRLWLEINLDETVIPALVFYGVLPASFLANSTTFNEHREEKSGPEKSQKHDKNLGPSLSEVIFKACKDILGEWVTCWEDILIVIVATLLALFVYLRRNHI